MRTMLRGKVTLLFMSLALVLALPAVALADNVQNDVVVGGNDTITAGGSTTINYRITANSGDGQSGCNASDGSSATVTINAPAGVTATPGSLTFSACQVGSTTNSKAVVFSSNTPGDYPITVSVSDSGTGTYNTSPATFTLHVNAPPNTEPVLNLPTNITEEATSAAGAVVTYTATATDAQDDPDPTPVCDPASGSTFPLGTTTVNCSVEDSGGLTDEGSFTVTVEDTTAPDLTLPADITEEATGPSGAVVNFTASADDVVDGSVNVDCTPASGSTFALGTTQVDCSATDAAGNTANGSFNVTVEDTTGPALTLPANITTTATSNSQATVNFTASAEDLVDGPRPVSCNPPSGNSFPAGTTTVNCSSADSRNNTSNGSFTVTVNYNWTGFFQPIDNNPDQTGDPTKATVWNSGKAGQVIPIKFSLGGNQGLAIIASGYPKTIAVKCPNATTYDPVETYSASNSAGLHYDSTANQYIYNWKTASSLAGTCQMLDLKLADGSHHYAFFKVTK